MYGFFCNVSQLYINVHLASSLNKLVRLPSGTGYRAYTAAYNSQALILFCLLVKEFIHQKHTFLQHRGTGLPAIHIMLKIVSSM